MRIAGIIGTTLLDYPGRIACVVFMAGCDLRCPFCQNPDLVLRPSELPALPLADLLADLERRRRLVDGLVISGGEPLLHDLAPLLEPARQLGYAVKVDTNGAHPDRLRDLLAAGLVDMVSLDVKTAPARYPDLGGPAAGEGIWDRVLESVRVTLEAGRDLETRTTVVPGWVDADAVDAIAAALGELGVARHMLQQFQAEHCLDEALRAAEPLPAAELEALAERARAHLPDVAIRGLKVE